MPEGYLHLTCEQDAARFTRSCKAATRKPTLRGKLASIRRRSAASLFATPARAAIASSKRTRRPRRDAKRPRTSHTKSSPDFVELIERKLTQEQWSPNQISRHMAKMASPLSVTSTSISISGKTRKTGAGCIFTCVTAAKNTTRRKGRGFGASADSEAASIWISGLLCRRKRPHIGASEAHTIIGTNHKGWFSCRTSSEPQIHQARQTAGREHGLCRPPGLAHALLPLANASKQSLRQSKKFTSHAQIAT